MHGLVFSSIHLSPSLSFSLTMQVFDSIEQCLSWGKFDAAVVMVPHHLHEDHASSLLRAGKHVLLEKPLAHTIASCKRLLTVAEQSKSVFMIGENSAHWPEVRCVVAGNFRGY